MGHYSYSNILIRCFILDDRRSTVISIGLYRNDGDDGSRMLMTYEPSDPSFDFSPSGEMERKKKCKICCRICCFNFWHCSCKKKELNLGDRPLYRDDVFYDGSLANLNFDPTERIQYHFSVTRVPDAKEVMQHMTKKCCVCHRAVIRTCVTMLGLNLLKSKIFSFMCLSSFFYTMGLYLPYVFVKGNSISIFSLILFVHFYIF